MVTALIETGASTAVPTSVRHRVLAAASALPVITYIDLNEAADG